MYLIMDRGRPRHAIELKQRAKEWRWRRYSRAKVQKCDFGRILYGNLIIWLDRQKGGWTVVQTTSQLLKTIDGETVIMNEVDLSLSCNNYARRMCFSQPKCAQSTYVKMLWPATKLI